VNRRCEVSSFSVVPKASEAFCDPLMIAFLRLVPRATIGKYKRQTAIRSFFVYDFVMP
jgi:hypothetical protein